MKNLILQMVPQQYAEGGGNILKVEEEEEDLPTEQLNQLANDGINGHSR